MTNSFIPWWPLLQSDNVKSEKKVSNKESNLPVSVARIVKFLDKNKNQKYTNKQIALEIGLSESTVSGITEKLEEIGIIKNPPSIRQSFNHKAILTYQSSKGYLDKSTVERVDYEGCIAQVLQVFEKNKNKIYFKKEIAEKTGLPKDKVSQAFPVLLVTGKIKVVGIENDLLIYQSIKGRKAAIEIATEPDDSYMTLGNYIEKNDIKGNLKEIKKKVAKKKGHSRLFYSNKGIVKEYEVSYLQEAVGLN